MYKIATLNKISKKGLNRFSEAYEVGAEIDQSNGVLVRSQDMHSMELGEGLLAIARAGAGVNNIPVDRCSEKGIVVFNTPGANANAVKELVLAGILMSARNIPEAILWANGLKEDAAKAVEKGKSQFAGREIMGKTLGVVGLGAIGVLVANAAEQLGMKVVGFDPYITLHAAHALSNTIPVAQSLDVMLPKCDYVTIHVPAMESTKGMFDATRFAQMKNSACLLNFSRDSLVVEKDLLDALKNGLLRKYVTDFPNDTVLHHSGVVCIPHLGASSQEAEDNCAMMAVDQLMDYLENGNITNSVNFPACSLGPVTTMGRVCVLNKNVPAMLGKITGIFADMNINISDLINRSKNDLACTLIDVDSQVDEDALRRALDAEEGIISVRVIQNR
ncbi:3-phosphoglycerate dehydrogenase family protein [Bacilliculturomica massiliensis]|uniref:3-phosphoglycerate dehydrogenase family protein n=1 Tax=Bacilliculturomica massiliensis TaxID=1917867 RepID=UPI00102FB0DD|nr:3-phosphoglycerate dehydrogenase family protein [Bacilliculturomica massiliensis]